MAGGKRRELIPLSATVIDTKHTSTSNEKEKFELLTWSNLPLELLELVFSPLSLKDNIRASVVCKRWNVAAVSVRKFNRPPWLMRFAKHGHFYELYDPAQRKTYSLELPELQGSRVCYSKDGWLLLYTPITHSMFFFNLFTKELIKLPRFELADQVVAFSSAPTSASCVVFTVKNTAPTVVAISTCHPGATEWVTIHYPNFMFYSSVWDNKIVSHSGHFYCLGISGWVGVFDIVKLTWYVLGIPPPKCLENIYGKNGPKVKFMAEYDGNILVVYSYCSENPVLFRLNISEFAWEEIKTLGGVTLFASSLSSYTRIDMFGVMRNNIYFPKVRFFGKRCISYSLDNCRYYPRKECHEWGKLDPFENIWIDPPDTC